MLLQVILLFINGLQREKTCLWIFWPCHTLAMLFSYRVLLENRNCTCSKFRYDTFQYANNEGFDQTCAGWSAPLLFANPEDWVSRIKALIEMGLQ